MTKVKEIKGDGKRQRKRKKNENEIFDELLAVLKRVQIKEKIPDLPRVNRKKIDPEIKKKYFEITKMLSWEAYNQPGWIEIAWRHVSKHYHRQVACTIFLENGGEEKFLRYENGKGPMPSYIRYKQGKGPLPKYIRDRLEKGKKRVAKIINIKDFLDRRN